MLDWLRDVVAPIKVNDGTFGAIRYNRDAKSWEGRTAFAPTRGVVEVLIWGDATGPSSEQRVFFNEVQQRYHSMWPAIRQELAAEAARVGAPATEFDLLAIAIPRHPSESAEWQFSYGSRPPSWHFTVQMQGAVPRAVIAEC